MPAQVLEAIPSLDSGENVTWKLCDKVGGQCNPNGNFPKITLPPGSGPATFTITINDVNHTGVLFDGDPNAMWIQPGTDCPQAYVFDSGGQIPKYNRVSDTKIMFTDANSEKGSLTLTYSLNFVRHGQAVTSLDPIISNGGCCPGNPRGTSSSTILLLAVAFVALLLLAYFGYRQFVKRPDTGVDPGSDIGE
jgi:hypothetical protein